MVGQTPRLQQVRDLIAAISRRSCTVLIHGESGSGKEMVARQIHAQSSRTGGPFIPVDCTTLRDTLSESQLFGHVKGAFTGAEQSTLGFFGAANGGTLFLDEIGELELQVQAKLLRCIQDSAVVPLGGVKPIPVDVRIVAATHRNLRQMVDAGRFRGDLYFRLNVVKLDVPPLRERMDDVLALAEHFLDSQARLYGESRKRLSGAAQAILLGYGWPGNVRELANVVEHAFVLSPGTLIDPEHFPDSLQANRCGTELPQPDAVVPLEQMERALICRALHLTKGNRGQAAQMLQIERHRLYRKIRRYGLSAFSP